MVCASQALVAGIKGSDLYGLWKNTLKKKTKKTQLFRKYLLNFTAFWKSFVLKLNGMFSFVDEPNSKMFLCVHRLNTLALFYFIWMTSSWMAISEQYCCSLFPHLCTFWAFVIIPGWFRATFLDAGSFWMLFLDICITVYLRTQKCWHIFLFLSLFFLKSWILVYHE